tara:strand:+ start:1192 stop:1431 length:240 start_codon:yes stop_codon:yes gene_type:complete
MDPPYVNSKITCPVCLLIFAKNYLKTHLLKQHQNIYNTPAWEGSKYETRYKDIKEQHKKKYSIGISNKKDDKPITESTI